MEKQPLAECHGTYVPIKDISKVCGNGSCHDWQSLLMSASILRRNNSYAKPYDFILRKKNVCRVKHVTEQHVRFVPRGFSVRRHSGFKTALACVPQQAPC